MKRPSSRGSPRAFCLRHEGLAPHFCLLACLLPISARRQPRDSSNIRKILSIIPILTSSDLETSSSSGGRGRYVRASLISPEEESQRHPPPSISPLRPRVDGVIVQRRHCRIASVTCMGLVSDPHACSSPARFRLHLNRAILRLAPLRSYVHSRV